jgi:UDP-N-acetyl-D-glucosamine dehydrogenase
MDTIMQKGGNVSYNDPHISKVKTNEGNQFQSVELNEMTLKEADCVVLTTNHDAFDVDFITKHAGLIVDMRNMIKEGNDNVYKL